MLQDATLFHADGIPVVGSSVADIDKNYFDEFFEKEFGESFEDQGISLAQLLENMNLAKEGRLNICGTLLFASKPHITGFLFSTLKRLPSREVDIEDVHYIDSRDVKGKLSDIFREVMGFLLANIRHVQNEQSFNSTGEPEIPRIVFEELVANSLIHRDYFISAPVRVLVFSDRVEITSPGRLPNNLTIENIKMGNSNIRNPILASFAPRVFPYRGIGSGIKRAIQAYPDIEFVDDQDGNTFRVTIQRKSER